MNVHVQAETMAAVEPDGAWQCNSVGGGRTDMVCMGPTVGTARIVWRLTTIALGAVVLGARAGDVAMTVRLADGAAGPAGRAARAIIAALDVAWAHYAESKPDLGKGERR